MNVRGRNSEASSAENIEVWALNMDVELAENEDKKLSWSELKEVVNSLRKQLSSLSTMVPTNVTFRTLPDAGVTRIYFLSAPQNGWETTLLFVDVPTATTTGLPGTATTCNSPFTCGGSGLTAAPPTIRLQWHCVIESNFPTIYTNKFSREEQLLWERKRMANWGINTYEMHEASGKIIFPASSSLFQCVDSGYSTGAHFPTKLRMTSSGAKLNPQICPSDADLVAYICQHDIWVTHTVSGCNVRLTYAHKGDRSLADDPLCAGVPSYVMQEEFSRYHGYWWQPHSPGGIYRVLYEEVDDGDVKIFCLSSSQSSDCFLLGNGNSNISIGTDGIHPTSIAGSCLASAAAVAGGSGGGASTTTAGTTTPTNNTTIGTCIGSSNAAAVLGCGEVEEFRFPRAGCANSKSYLKLIEFRVSDTRQIVDVVMLELQFSLNILFPWMEYIVRAGWTPDGDFIWVQLLDRRQQRLDIVLLSLSNFTEVLPMYDDSSSSSPDLSNPLVQVIYSEESNVWINVHDILYFLPTRNNPNEIQFIWASEETGFRHLYLVTSQIMPYGTTAGSTGDTTTTAGNGTAAVAADPITQQDYVSLQPRILSKVGLTSGDWEVLGQDIWVDEPRQLVYFMGLKESVLEKHLYVVSMRRPGVIRLLTKPGYSYVVDLNKECSLLLSVYSNTGNVPACQIYRISHEWTHVDGVQLSSVGYLQQQQQQQQQLVLPENATTNASACVNTTNNTSNNSITSAISNHISNMSGAVVAAPLLSSLQQALTSTASTATSLLSNVGSGATAAPPAPLAPATAINATYTPDLYTYRGRCALLPLHAMVFRPHGWQPGRRYPAVLNVYGGPEVQLVSNTFKGMRQLRLHMLAARGYCVIAIDSRGSQHRGLQFEAHLRRRMGTVELADQVEVLRWLADTLGYIDLDRVAIHGWSYGGYLSLMGLVQRPDVFKLAIAGAPVTNWALYDTGYTERYMDLPENNTQGYTDGSVLNYINKFPEDENRLLIIHGLIDENVHFYHTSQLISALIKAGKPYQLQIYPNERHSLRHLDASKHYETTLLAFLQNHL